MKKLTLLLVSMLLYVTTPAQIGYDTNLNKTKKEIKELNRENIKLDLTIYIDNIIVNDDNQYLITIDCLTQKFKSTLLGSNSFLLYLHYDNEYIISFTHKGCDTKRIYVNTKSPYDNWYLIAQIKLKSKSNDIAMTGKIFFDPKIQNYRAVHYTSTKEYMHNE